MPLHCPKEKEKENQYKIRKIKEKKNKIVSVQASYNTTLLESAEEFQVVRSKCKEVSLEEDMDCWLSKKAKGKQLARYHGDLRVKMGNANFCERYVCAGQDCLVHNSR